MAAGRRATIEGERCERSCGRPPSDPETLDHAAVVALDSEGSIVGRATLARLYGLRAEIRLELAPTTMVALALVDALEREARKRRLSVSRSMRGPVRVGGHGASPLAADRDELRATHRI